MEVLKGHVSPETAIVVEDYPYGFRLRCRMRYWLEYQPKKGFRRWSQTTNPKVTVSVTPTSNVLRHPWNKPKASVYTYGLEVLVRDAANGYISDQAIRFDNCTASELANRLEQWRDALPEQAIRDAETFVRIKTRYEELKGQGVDYRDASRQAIWEEAKRAKGDS